MKKLTALILILMLLACSVAPVLAAEEPTVNIVSASLSLEDNVYIWFDMTLNGAEFESSEYGMIFWTAEQTEYTYANAETSSEAVIRTKDEGSISHDDKLSCDVATFKYGVAAKQMTDVIRAQAYVKTSTGYAYSAVKAYSVQEYAANKLGLTPGVTGTTDEKLKTLLRDMLDYGASAQIYFGYKTDDLANAILNAPVITEPTIVISSVSAKAGEAVKVTVSLKNNPGIAGAKIYIAYDSKLTMTEATAGETFAALDYMAPQALTSGCAFNWDSLDQEVTEDGTLITLTFTVSESVAAGEQLEVKVSYDDGDIYNKDLDDVLPDRIDGIITVS